MKGRVSIGKFCLDEIQTLSISVSKHTHLSSVNMYASTWLCTKTADLHELPTPSPSQHANGNDTFGRRITRSRSALDPLDIGDAAME